MEDFSSTFTIEDGANGGGSGAGSRRRRSRSRREQAAQAELEAITKDVSKNSLGLKPLPPKKRNKAHKNKFEKHQKGKPFGKGPSRYRERRDDFAPRPSGARTHAETWWGERWIDALYRFGWKGRLRSGQIYAQEGRVEALEIEPGRIKAKVAGTAVDPYTVTVALRPLSDVDWDLVSEIMSCQALYTAQLLAGEMPPEVEEVFQAARAPLFPRHKEDLRAHCNCPDFANPCKHIAAVYFAAAQSFDRDPFLLFSLRGRTKEQFLAAIRAQRAAEAQAIASMALDHQDAASLEPVRFYQAGEELDSVAIAIAPPAQSTAKRLGRPPFWRSPADPVTRLPEIYEAISRRAREVALQ